MLFLTRIVPALLAVTGLVQATSSVTRNNDTPFSEFIDVLYKHNLTTVAESYKKSAKNKAGKANLQLLKTGGSFTVLAPQDSDFDKNHGLLDLDMLQYDQLWGSIYKHFRTSDNSHYRRDAPWSSREPAFSTFPRKPGTGNNRRTNNNKDLSKYQVQVIDQFFTPKDRKRWSGERTIFVDRDVGNAKVVKRFTFKNIVVLVTDTVLTLPKAVSELLCLPLIRNSPNGFQKFKKAFEKIGKLDWVNNKDELTLFVPVDESFDLDNCGENELPKLMRNHFFFGKIVFTPSFTSVCKAKAQSGKELEFSYENDIHYVSCGKTRAVVLRGDVTTRNGVMHIIDRPLEC